jgi:cephalosporin hydroxylase
MRFIEERRTDVRRMAQDERTRDLGVIFIRETMRYKYSYNFSWLGRPIIQFPQDIVAIQEIIWEVKPDLIIETGIAHGGGLVFYASILELLGGDRKALGIDVDIRDYNRIMITRHPMAGRIDMIQGSSVDKRIVEQVYDYARNRHVVMVILDSNHTHTHVLEELKMYSPLVTKGSYLIVFDTSIEDMPAGSFLGRPWDKGNNPKTAVREFLKANDRFEIDESIQNRLIITAAKDGYLKCVKD